MSLAIELSIPGLFINLSGPLIAVFPSKEPQMRGPFVEPPYPFMPDYIDLYNSGKDGESERVTVDGRPGYGALVIAGDQYEPPQPESLVGSTGPYAGEQSVCVKSGFLYVVPIMGFEGKFLIHSNLAESPTVIVEVPEEDPAEVLVGGQLVLPGTRTWPLWPGIRISFGGEDYILETQGGVQVLKKVRKK